MRTRSRPLSGHSCVSRLFLAVIFPRQPSCAPSTRAAYGKLASHGGGLAHSVISLNGCLNVEELSSLPDEEFIAALTAIIRDRSVDRAGRAAHRAAARRRGVAGRPGAAQDRAERYQLDHLPSQQEVVTVADTWRPYRSLATSYLFSAAFDVTSPSLCSVAACAQSV